MISHDCSHWFPSLAFIIVYNLFVSGMTMCRFWKRWSIWCYSL